MDFLDKLGKKASDTYKYTTEKTSKIAKETKLKIAMNEDKSKIEEIYAEIGKNIYEAHVREDEINIEEILDNYCSKIDELSNKIEETRKEILMLKDKKQCENCFFEIDLEDNFCPNCGAKQ